MNCPLCGWASSVVRTLMGPKVLRRRRCECGAEWTSVETVQRASLRAPNSGRRLSLGATPTARDIESSPVLDLSAPSEADPDPTSVVSKPGGQEYPAAFEEFWSLCRNAGRGKGNKYPALKAWLKLKPDPKVTAETWNLWMETPTWFGGYNPDVSRWLNERGYERRPSEVEMRARNGTTKAQRTANAAGEWLAERQAK